MRNWSNLLKIRHVFDESSNDTHFCNLVKAYLQQHRLQRLALAKQLLQQKLKVRQNFETLVSGILVANHQSEEEMKESEKDFNSKQKKLADELSDSEKDLALQPTAQISLLQSNHSSIADEVVRKWDALATPIIQRKLIEE